MKIPLLDLKREYNFFKREIQSQVKDCFRSQAWILGPKMEQFERAAARYLKVKYALGVASGTDALILSLHALALKCKKGPQFDSSDEIITTPFTFLATAEAIVRSGARPVFVDIEQKTFNIDPVKINKAINKNTVGILPVHLFGLAANMGAIKKIAAKYNLFIVEDSAQAFGARYHGKKVGTLGDSGAFSFFPSKNLGACGEGGLITTNCRQLAQLIEVLRNHGQTKNYNAAYIGYNSRLDSLQAAILLAKLKYLDRLNQRRRKIAQKYNKRLKKIGDICIPYVPEGSDHVYHLYTLRVQARRNALLKYLNSAGIAARIYYPLGLNKMVAFKGSKASTRLINTQTATGEVLSLPIHPFLKDREVEYILARIEAFFSP